MLSVFFPRGNCSIYGFSVSMGGGELRIFVHRHLDLELTTCLYSVSS